ncbi:hypothetical protein [Massilia sp. TS11]|uniref:hypothetical protein n=1 Tax=Massilia sp. TS11 TaxID=2908003 RepID=UPI001EDA26BF|nr:hypothetical protein [Massilia sp. TS11]MCG2583071.1 hypothetical protein [Massilia sp. TS11]
MNKKLALLLFALGLGASSAYARLPDCEWNCYLEWKSCKAFGGTDCDATRAECDAACSA